MPSLNQDVLGRVQIPVAPFEEQRAIKTATMQRLLTGEQRLPGFSAPWTTMRLGDVMERIVGGGTPSRSNPNYWDGQIPWMTVKDFNTFDPSK